MRPTFRLLRFALVALGLGSVIGIAAGQLSDRAVPDRGASVRVPIASGPALGPPPSAVRTETSPPSHAALPPHASLPPGGGLRPPRPEAPARALPTWQRNAVAVTVPPGRNIIAIVIDDMGVDRARSARAAALPAPLTLAYLPYARGFESQIAAARAHGHEILVHVPMEPVGIADPGPNALSPALGAAEIRRRTAAALARAASAVGINNHMGSRFTVERAAMEPVLAELKARELLFLDSLTTPASVAASLAREMGVPHAVRDVFLDNDPAPGAVRARLADLEAIAARHGHAIGIGHPHDGTLAALEAWIPGVSARGFVLVPVSAIVRLAEERRERS